MSKSPRCLYDSDIKSFLSKEKETVLGILCERYHGDALTTTRDAWMKEIEVMQTTLIPWSDTEWLILL